MGNSLFILFIVVAAIQGAIALLFSIKISRWKSLRLKNTPKLSIIVAARNEYENLKKLIPRLLELSYDEYEICIGLDRCNDESLKYLRSIKDARLNFIDIQNVPSDWNSKKYALDQAIKLSDGEWLVFTDADCLPSEKWLNAISTEISNERDIIIGVSPYTYSTGYLNNYIRFEAFVTAFLYSALTLFKKPYMAVGRNMAIRRSYFNEVGGYSEIKDITGGDDDLFIQKHGQSKRVGLVLGKDSIVYSNPKSTWRSYFSQKIRHFSVGTHYKLSNQFFLSFYHLTHVLSYALIPFIFKREYLISILLFYLFIKLVSYRFAAGKIGSGFNYILLPLVDITYAFLTPVLGIWSKLEKDIKWKN